MKPSASSTSQDSPQLEKGSPSESKTMKPTVFIASSAESLAIAHHVKEYLEEMGVANVTVWDEEDVFQPSEYLLNSIKHYLDISDFGIFVLAPDDTVQFGDDERKTARDNVIFELGMCFGILGQQRSILLAAGGEPKLRIPSDLSGVTYNWP